MPGRERDSSKTPRARVLVAADECPGPLAFVRGLHSAGYEPWVVLGPGPAYVARSRAARGVTRLPQPHDDPDGWAHEVAALARRLGVEAVLPATEATLHALTGREERFGEIVVGTSPQAALDRATDKGGLAGLAERHGLRAPASIVVEGDAPDLSGIPLPAVVKPARTLEGDESLVREGACVVRDVHELRAALSGPARARVVQPLVTGVLTAVSGLAWRGEVLSALHQRSPRIWPPVAGTTAYAETVAPDHEVGRGVAGIVAETGWSGIYNVQLLAGPDGPLVIDFNPRVYGSFALTLAAGQNLAAAWVERLLGRSATIPDYRIGVGLRIEDQEAKAVGRLAVRGDVRGARRALRPRADTHHAVFSARDPGPALVTAVRLWRGATRRIR